MNKIEQIKELKLLFESGVLNQEQYTKLLNEIVEKSEKNTNIGFNESEVQNDIPIKSGEKIEDYKSVIIGNQEWMSENLNVKTFKNGEPIPRASTQNEWERATKLREPAWCYYDDDPENGNKYGLLYNIYALYDSRGLAPAGWQLPSKNNFKELIQICGGKDSAGRKLKSRNEWNSFHFSEEDELTVILGGEKATNESGLNVKPGGYIICHDSTYRHNGEGYSYSKLEFGTEIWTPEIFDWGDGKYVLSPLAFNGDNYVNFSNINISSFHFAYVRCVKKQYDLKESTSSKLSDKIAVYENFILETFKKIHYDICKISASHDNSTIYYEIVSEAGFRISTIKNIREYFIYELSLKLNLSISDIRFITPIPGKGTLGVEIAIYTEETQTQINIDFEKEANLKLNADSIQKSKQINSSSHIIEKSENAIEVKLTDNDLKIVKWLKNIGQEVTFYDSLFEYEIDNDKATLCDEFDVSTALGNLDMGNFKNFKGILTEIILKEGDYTPNSVICIIEPDANVLHDYLSKKSKIKN